MKEYRIFEVSDMAEKLKGNIKCRLDDDDKTIFKSIRQLGFNINRRRNKLIWWDDDYAEIINKKSDLTIGVMELAYR